MPGFIRRKCLVSFCGINATWGIPAFSSEPQNPTPRFSSSSAAWCRRPSPPADSVAWLSSLAVHSSRHNAWHGCGNSIERLDHRVFQTLSHLFCGFLSPDKKKGRGVTPITRWKSREALFMTHRHGFYESRFTLQNSLVNIFRLVDKDFQNMKSLYTIKLSKKSCTTFSFWPSQLWQHLITTAF